MRIMAKYEIFNKSWKIIGSTHCEYQLFLKENFFSDASILVVWDRNKIENYLEFDVVELIINQCLSLGTSLFSYANRVVVLNANDDYQV